jgi:hypothetical protein
MNIDKVLLKKLLAAVLCLTGTSIPGTLDSAIRSFGLVLIFPVFPGCFGVGLEVCSMLLDSKA